MSAIFYHNEEQKREAEASLASRLKFGQVHLVSCNKGGFPNILYKIEQKTVKFFVFQVATRILPLEKFVVAEE